MPTPPSEDFRNLNLGEGEMVATTRARSARNLSSNQPQGPGNSPTRENIIISDSTGIKYDVSDLDEQARRRAEVGLGDETDSITVKYCTEKEDEGESYYVFKISDQISVRLGTDHPRYNVPDCTCGANEGGIACKHIYWLEDQIAIQAPPAARTRPIHLASDGSRLLDMSPSKAIDRIKFENIAKNQGWVLHEDGSDLEDADEKMLEMLSVFEPSGALPNEFKDGTGPKHSQSSRIYKQFANLITKYAIDDVGMFHQLRQIIPPGFEATIFFEKMNDRVSKTFDAFDEYVESGPAAGDQCDVVTCADRLNDLERGIQERVAEGFGAKDAAIHAAAALITILEGVVERKGDAYENISWTRVKSEDEEAQEIDLYERLIGDPVDESRPFILGVLKDFPEEIRRIHVDRLSSIGEKLESYHAPKRYLNLFRTITFQGSRKRLNPEAGGSSAKKPMK
ncbi:hypothetical protein K432DRAFT_323449 [Lepidopterella palustris CBS 459.81]|uniref:SWIM-type domain-containing protein n=1 Tax=Lepidopterella palustris CBS 459.81 TaxID=1314670 RepID=A0A8E2JHU8_9PEZI|nr:hypothetical protein K432DRAFT_323449 [Lepidopterella palustris CBS 459.81]